jgi:hypothetical protein
MERNSKQRELPEPHIFADTGGTIVHFAWKGKFELPLLCRRSQAFRPLSQQKPDCSPLSLRSLQQDIQRASAIGQTEN